MGIDSIVKNVEINNKSVRIEIVNLNNNNFLVGHSRQRKAADNDKHILPQRPRGASRIRLHEHKLILLPQKLAKGNKAIRP